MAGPEQDWSGEADPSEVIGGPGASAPFALCGPDLGELLGACESGCQSLGVDGPMAEKMLRSIQEEAVSIREIHPGGAHSVVGEGHAIPWDS